MAPKRNSIELLDDNSDLSELSYRPNKIVVLGDKAQDSFDDEESEDDEGRCGIWFSNGDGEFVDLPDDFTPETHKQVLSEIIDEVVMLMKDARDEAAYECNFVCRVENNKLKQLIYQTECKYDLPDGTIKESTVVFRLKSYKKKKDHKMSHLKDIEPRLITELSFDYKNPRFVRNPVAAFYGGNMIRRAKELLTVEHPWGSGEKRYHNLAIDYVQLDENWRRDFLTRNYDAFVEKGIHVLGFPGALEFHEQHGWDMTKWQYEASTEYDEKCASYRMSVTSGKSNKLKENGVAGNTTTKGNCVNATKENTVNTNA